MLPLTLCFSVDTLILARAATLPPDARIGTWLADRPDVPHHSGHRDHPGSRNGGVAPVTAVDPGYAVDPVRSPPPIHHQARIDHQIFAHQDSKRAKGIRSGCKDESLSR